MRRILHVLNALQRSGAEVMLAAAAPHFRAAGLETHILSTGTEVGAFGPALEHAGYIVHHLPFARTPGYFACFRRLLARVEPDVTHIHCEQAAVAYAALAAPRAPVVRTIHGWFEFTGPLRLRKATERWLSRHLFGVVHVAPGAGVQENERRRFANDTLLCPNWYDETRFLPPTNAARLAARDSFGFAPEDLVVISVGSHQPVKNYAAGLAAVGRLVPRDRVKFLHVGRAIDLATGVSLAQVAAELGLGDRARFAGETDEVARHLHAADVHLMPSLREGMGLAAVEAMATGLPQVLADVPGLADFRGMAPGIVHAPPTVDGLAAALTALAALDVDDRRRLGAPIAEIARDRFSTAVGAARYIKLYADRLA